MIPDMTYAQWESWKKSENRYVWETYQKKGRNYSSDQKQFEKYQTVLGKNAPTIFCSALCDIECDFNNDLITKCRICTEIRQVFAHIPIHPYQFRVDCAESLDSGILNDGNNLIETVVLWS